MKETHHFMDNLQNDLPAGISVFLIAVPLSSGVAVFRPDYGHHRQIAGGADQRRGGGPGRGGRQPFPVGWRTRLDVAEVARGGVAGVWQCRRFCQAIAFPRLRRCCRCQSLFGRPGLRPCRQFGNVIDGRGDRQTRPAHTQDPSQPGIDRLGRRHHPLRFGRRPAVDPFELSARVPSLRH